MDAIHLIGRITESGKLEIELPPGVEPGQVRVTIEGIDPDQAWFWTKRWQEGERDVDEDYKAGRFYEFKDADSAIAALHKAVKKRKSGEKA